MLVYRIALAEYSQTLKASGRAARWNPNKVAVIYTSSSRSLACLENVVHRSQFGLNRLFNIMTIRIDNRIKKEIIRPGDLPEDWKEFNQMPVTQQIGAKWILENRSAILQIPSSIIEEEANYLLNPLHADYKKHIRLIRTEPFEFDKRIKL